MKQVKNNEKCAMLSGVKFTKREYKKFFIKLGRVCAKYNVKNKNLNKLLIKFNLYKLTPPKFNCEMF